MTDDLNIWLEGAPVIPMPGGESLEIWLEGAPVVTLGGDSATAVVTGSECETETGTVTATGGAVATVTGSECETETGIVTASEIATATVTGSECECETGVVAASGGSVAEVTGSECQTETGIVGVTIIPPIPPTPVPTGGAKVHSRVLEPWDFEPRKKRPERYRRRKREQLEKTFEPEIPEIPVVVLQKLQSTVIARVYGSECRFETGIFNVRVDYPDDAEAIKLIMEVLEMADRISPGLENSQKPALNHKRTNKKGGFPPGAEEEELELILMLSEEI